MFPHVILWYSSKEAPASNGPESYHIYNQLNQVTKVPMPSNLLEGNHYFYTFLFVDPVITMMIYVSKRKPIYKKCLECVKMKNGLVITAHK